MIIASRSIAVIAVLGALGACVPRTAPPQPVAPPPVQSQAVRPPAVEAPPPPVPDVAWMDAPLSAGRWTYSDRLASFGTDGVQGLLVRCAGRGRILLGRGGVAPATSLTFRTSAMSRTIPATMQPEGPLATIDANDPLLDALAFSRGRFAVEAPGLERLIVPAWPELARVVEDCRR